MSVLSFLHELSSDALQREPEKAKIRRSIQTLEGRLAEHFGDQITDAFPFGSSVRGTSLPQFYSESTDIDYMVVFDNDGRTPAAYLQRLLAFGKQWYPRSEVRQAAPAVVIRLSHVTFELVPALPATWNAFKIPTTDGRWQGANPRGLEATLVSRNKDCGGLLKPAIRLAKLWNAEHDYVFTSFDLEKQAVGFLYPFANNTRDYFFAIMNKLNLDISQAAWRYTSLESARQTIKAAKQFEVQGDAEQAIRSLKSLFP